MKPLALEPTKMTDMIVKTMFVGQNLFLTKPISFKRIQERYIVAKNHNARKSPHPTTSLRPNSFFTT